MPEAPKTRPSRLQRERRLRRRRAAALFVVAAVAGGILALTLAFSSGSGKGRNASSSTVPATTGSNHAQKPRKKQASKAALARQHRKLEAQADRAITHFEEVGLPIYCGGTKKKVVALTFDDGPGPYTQGSVLHVLRERHARATFFLVGRRIQDWPNLPRKEAKVAAIGDHTWNHALLTGLDDNAMNSELEDAKNAIEESTGIAVKLFRPPYGAHNATIDREVSALGMVEIMWSLDSLDWQGGNWKELIARVLSEVRPGSIILMHDIHPNTIAAVWKLVPDLHHLGYRLVTVPELLALDPPTERQVQLGAGGCAGNATQPGAG